MKSLSVNILFLGLIIGACANPKTGSQATAERSNSSKDSTMTVQATNIDTATFGAGCFWCVEAVFQQVDGVLSVASGYMGGKIANPTYKEVCSGLTGHAEVIQLTYDATKVGYKDLLEIFWKTHDPTTLNRQGADAGTQYRSAVFYHSAAQQELAEKYKKELDASGAFDKPIVTEVSAATPFYKAEDYHQNYFNENGDQPYCSFVIKPKLDKFRKVFPDKLKK